jgi:sulfhydrogenase subunit beta (sulfur reductase)
MKDQSSRSGSQVTIQREDFQQLLDALKKLGYQSIGPTVQNNGIVLDDIDNVNDLPLEWADEQDSATYRLQKRTDGALFGYVLGHQSWKKYLYPCQQELNLAKRGRAGWKVSAVEVEIPKYAFVGVRPCEIHALAALDKVFIEGEYPDPGYQARRENAVVVAVNCAVVGGTCFCDSMGTGPKAESGFDLALTEIQEGGNHYFVVEIGTKRGANILKKVAHKPATKQEVSLADKISAEAATKMGRKLETADVKDLLYRHVEHPHWKDVAARCLTCSNCTMVCPTCFCSTVEDYTDLQGNEAYRQRRVDSCFTMEYSYIHGGSVRYSTEARYRQWLTHKFATWVDQYGMFGCVGCGRCITWCPAGIDITEEIRTIRVSEILDTMTASAKES